MTENTQRKRGGQPKDITADKTLGGVRVSETQLQKYKDTAKRKGQSFSAWVRAVLDKAADK